MIYSKKILIAQIFESSEAKVVLHGHWQLPGRPIVSYAFPGTDDEDNVWYMSGFARQFNVANHGFYAIFDSIYDAESFMRDTDAH